MADHPVISERDRRDASAVTLSGSGHVFELQLGHLCNNRCVFCSSGMLTEQGLAKPVPLADIFAAIDQAKAAGARRLVFVGGEPTLHKGFVDALARAVAVGFEDVVIFTNGVTLPRPGFIDQCVALGDFEWRISIQGADEAAHVAVTGRPHSFTRIVEGLRELARRGQRVTMNMCVNARSYASLPGYPALVAEHGIRQIHIDVVRPASTGRKSLVYFEDVMPRYSAMAPYFEQMLEGFAAAADAGAVGELGPIEVSVGNLPHCVLRRWPGVIVHGGEPTITAAADPTGLEPEVDKYAWHASLREHTPACEACVLRGECSGVFRTYRELYGDAELVPITHAELLALPPARRPFLVLARRALAGLLGRAGQPPAGWRLDARVEDRHARVLALTWVGPSGARVTLRFVSPERAAAGDWDNDGAPILARTDVFTLALVADHRAERAVPALLRWALGGVAGVAGVGGPELEAALARQRRATAVQLRARQILTGLTAGPAPDGWRWGPIQASPGRVAAPLLRLAETGTGTSDTLLVALDLALGAGSGQGTGDADAPRPITLDLAPSPGADPIAVEAAITQVLRALERG